VTLVSNGAGDLALITLRAVCLLQSADVILFDARLPRSAQVGAPRARKLLVGTTDFGPLGNENDINAWSALLDGKRVVRLKSGDSNAAKIVIELVPGITAAQSAVSNFGLPPADPDRVVFCKFSLAAITSTGSIQGHIA